MRSQRSGSRRDRLRIGIIAPPWVPVPPPVYGGTELMVDVLARGLVAAGHDVTLFATGDSSCPVPTRWAYPLSQGTNASSYVEFTHVIRAYEALEEVDIVHDHTVLGPMWARSISAPPTVATVHLPFTPEITAIFAAAARTTAIVAVSYAQRDSAPPVAVARVIHHGLEVDAYPHGAGRGGYVAFLGRMSPEKGPDRAIHAARRAGVRLAIAAKMWEPHERTYFEEQVAPLLGDDAVYVGELGGREKLDFLANAAALVNPIRWPEPFGLVMIEALACGTPVVAFAEGAAPEIIVHGRTGFLCRDEADMAHGIRRIGGIDRSECRAHVRARFSATRMVQRYEALYADILQGRPGPSERSEDGNTQTGPTAAAAAVPHELVDLREATKSGPSCQH